jgi:secretion/DNA translocation related TadE-like protein
MSGSRPTADRGSGSILILALAAVVGVAGLSCVAMTQGLTVRHEVAGAADLAALAAASAAGDCLSGRPCPVGGGCSAAAAIAKANGVRLIECTLVDPEANGPVADVVVERGVHRFGPTGSVRARSRAGPRPGWTEQLDQCSFGAPASRVASRAAAPRLSRDRLPFPQVGDCTQDGHPASHGQPATRSWVVPNHRGATA